MHNASDEFGWIGYLGVRERERERESEREKERESE
jgi:hypothetical protein